ncbi:MAG TPA: HIT domain-containing protein [Polyangia bacterium]|jgi:ATP adenylyltransferase|nr:HIT domain-containing protein [Polyangia bacterium]
MRNLWAPWRAAYVLGEAEAVDGCFFCIGPARAPDRWPEDLVLCATSEVSVMLNAYPYVNGHLLIAPREHVARPGDLGAGAHDALFRMVTLAAGVLEKAMAPDGLNIGVNQGRVAGAGIVDHVHVHLVPRWNGDTNFMPVIAETTVMPQHLKATYAQLRPHFADLRGAGGVGAGAVHGS